MGTEFFPWVKCGRGATLTPHPLLVTWSRKSIAIPLLPLWAVWPVQSLSACTVQLYLYSPYGPYGLYRASVPVQGYTHWVSTLNQVFTPLHNLKYQMLLLCPLCSVYRKGRTVSSYISFLLKQYSRFLLQRRNLTMSWCQHWEKQCTWEMKLQHSAFTYYAEKTDSISLENLMKLVTAHNVEVD